MANNIEDFILKFVFNDDNSVKKIRKLAKDLDTMEVKSKRNARSDTDRAKKKSSQNKRESREQAKSLSLDRARLTLKKKINRAEELGLSTKSAKATYSRATKLETVNRRNLELENSIVDAAKLQKRLKTSEDAKGAVDPSIKKSLRDQKEFLKFQDAVSKEKLRDTKAQITAQAKLNQVEGKRRSSAFNADTDPRLRAVKRSSNFRNLQSGGIEEKAYAAKMFSNMEQNLARNTKAATEAFRDQKAELNRVSRAYVRNTKQALGLTTVQKGLNDSTRNLIRGYASLYAVVGSVSAINRAGQTLESMRASMLLTSADAEQVGKNLEFVEAQSIRLGLSLGESSKAFVRFASAAKGNLEQAAIEDVFLGIAEAGTVSQLTTDDMNGAFRA